jgi:hypothetical protein
MSQTLDSATQPDQSGDVLSDVCYTQMTSTTREACVADLIEFLAEQATQATR